MSPTGGVVLVCVSPPEGDFLIKRPTHPVGLGGRAGHEGAGRASGLPDVPLHSDRDWPLLTDEAVGDLLPHGPHGDRPSRAAGLPVSLPVPDFPRLLRPTTTPSRSRADAFAEFFTSGIASAFTRFAGAGERWEGEDPRRRHPRSRPTATRSADRIHEERPTRSLTRATASRCSRSAALVARELLEDRPQPLLEPFRMGRFAAGTMHQASQSPYPWT